MTPAAVCDRRVGAHYRADFERRLQLVSLRDKRHADLTHVDLSALPDGDRAKTRLCRLRHSCSRRIRGEIERRSAELSSVTKETGYCCFLKMAFMFSSTAIWR